MGPVISARARDTILNYIETGKTEGRLISGGGAAPAKVTCAADRDRRYRFEGPYLSGRDLRAGAGRDQGHETSITRLEMANDSDYGLTGAVYTNDKTKVEKARRRVLCGQHIYQPQMHGRDGGGASLWRIQYVGHGFEGRRPGLFVAVSAGEIDCGEDRLTALGVLILAAVLTVAEGFPFGGGVG